MIPATRKQLIELEDGSVQFSVVVAAEHVHELLSLAPLPGSPIVLARPAVSALAQATPVAGVSLPAAPTPPEFKPPTQTVAPAGESHSTFGPAGAREARQAFELCNNPWFQQYARAKRPDAKNPDDLELAKGYMVTTVAPAGKWTSESTTLFQGVMKDYRAWCQAKGYSNG